MHICVRLTSMLRHEGAFNVPLKHEDCCDFISDYCRTDCAGSTSNQLGAAAERLSPYILISCCKSQDNTALVSSLQVVNCSDKSMRTQHVGVACSFSM